jgi:tRNA A37 methylthiotransferase MiaB
MKVTDYQHEGWCDTQNNISNSCNCIVGYPLEVIEDFEKALIFKKLTNGYELK